MTRRAWLFVTGGYVCMAVGFIVFGFLLSNHVNTIRATQKTALATQRGLVGEQRALEGVAVRNAQMVCLIAIAPGGSNNARRTLLDEYVRTGHPPPADRYGPPCPEVVAIARKNLRH